LTQGEDNGGQLKEADLAGHLVNPDDNGDRQDAAPDAESQLAADKDYALSEALNLLKGLSILGPTPAG
jgi:carboxyl-terminal processing protease